MSGHNVIIVFTFALCTFSILIVLCGAYSGLIPAHPEHPGKCIYRDVNLKVGKNPGLAPCQQLTCYEDGSIFIEGCGKLRIENCNRGERLNTNKPYPECCKLKYKCKHADGTPFFIEKDVSDQAIKAQNTA